MAMIAAGLLAQGDRIQVVTLAPVETVAYVERVIAAWARTGVAVRIGFSTGCVAVLAETDNVRWRGMANSEED